MNPYTLMVLVVYASAALLSSSDRRALSWTMAGASSYLISVLYWELGLPMPVVFAGLCDFLIILALNRWARQIWEMWIWLMFQLSLLLNIVHALGVSGEMEHTVALELLNIVIALTIGGTSAFTVAGHVDGRAHRPWRHVLGRLRHVYREDAQD